MACSPGSEAKVYLLEVAARQSAPHIGRWKGVPFPALSQSGLTQKQTLTVTGPLAAQMTAVLGNRWSPKVNLERCGSQILSLMVIGQQIEQSNSSFIQETSVWP